MAAYRCAGVAGMASALHLGSRYGPERPRNYAHFLAALGAGTASVAGLCSAYSQPVRCEEQPDRLKTWQGKWDVNQLGWHLDAPNPQLQRFLGELVPLAGRAPHATGMGPRVLLPLCGKSVDMAWLSRKGYRVVGIEGVRKAVDDFATEHSVMGHSVAIGLPPNLDAESFRAHAVLLGAGDGEATRAEPPPPVLMIEGDFLKVGETEAKALVPFEAAFDRGSLVAVSPECRKAYAHAMTSLMEPGGRVLLVTVEHDPFANGSLGPPFEVTEADVHTMYADHFDVRLLLREDRFDKEPAWAQRGATRFHECVYLLTKHGAPPAQAAAPPKADVTPQQKSAL